MAAPSIKSGSGPTLLAANNNNPSSPDLDTAATNSGTQSNSNIDSHATGTGSVTYWRAENSTGNWGCQRALSGSTSINAEGEVLLCHIQVPNILTKFQIDTIANNGILVSPKSSPADYARFVVDAFDSSNPLLDYCGILIAPSHTTSRHSSGGTLDADQITSVEFHTKLKSGYTFRTIYTGKMYHLKPYVILNGDAGDPATHDKAYDDVDANYLRILTRSGSLRGQSFSVYFGDGVTDVYSSVSNRTIQYPEPTGASGTDRRNHFPPGHFGEKFQGAGASTFLRTNVTWSGPHHLDLAPVSGDTCTLTGSTNNGATRFTANQYATLSNHSFTNSCTIDLSQGFSWTGTLNVSNTTGSFTVDASGMLSLENLNLTANSGGSEYAAYVDPSSGDTLIIDNDTVDFNGYASGKKLYIDLASGSLTINAGGTLATTDVTAAGSIAITFDATTTTIKHTGLANGTVYRIHNLTTATDLAVGTVSGGSGFTESFTSGISTNDVIVLLTAYQSGTTVKWGGPWPQTATAGGTVDFSANTPTTKSEFVTWNVDGSTVTEIAGDFTGTTEIDIDTGTSISAEEILAFFAYAIATTDGLTYWAEPEEGFLLNIKSAIDVEINVDVQPILFDNVNWSTQNVRITSGMIALYCSDGSDYLKRGLSRLHNPSGQPIEVSSGTLTMNQQTQLAAAASAANLPTLAQILAATIEDDHTLKQAMRQILSAAIGESEKIAEGQYAFKKPGDPDTTRFQIDVDQTTAERSNLVSTPDA